MLLPNNPVTFLEQNMSNNLVMLQFINKSDASTHGAVVLDETIGRLTIDKSNPDDQVIKIDGVYSSEKNHDAASTISAEIHYFPQDKDNPGTFTIKDTATGFDEEPKDRIIYPTTPEKINPELIPITHFYDASLLVAEQPDVYFFTHQEVIELLWENTEVRLIPVSSAFPVLIPD